MTPLHHMQIPNIPIVEGEKHQSCIPFLSLGTSSSSSIAHPSIPFDYQQVHTDEYNLLHHHPHLQEEIGQESCYFRNYFADQSSSTGHGSVKWMSSKMRIMRKMMSSDEQRRISKSRRSNQQAMEAQNLEGSSGTIHGGIVRVCSDCSTTKTPLWRSGPRGPKSLCNACGIRQRKARRAMAAAEVSGTGHLPATAGKTTEKDNASDVDRTVPFKKRCRFAAIDQTAPKKLCFEDMVISLNKSSSFQHVFPQDEKDAAILLMALSCGLICS